MTIALSPINNRSACDELRKQVAADHISVHPLQLVIPEERLRKIDDRSVRELAASIKEVGQLQPIGVKGAGPNTNRYIVIYGARRARAYQLLHQEAMEKATDPNTDQDVFRYSQLHALKFRQEISDETCRELEIRENLDRKELTAEQKKAHMLQLAAIIQPREQTRKEKLKREEAQSRDGPRPILNERGNTKRKRTPRAPVREQVAAALGVSGATLDSRLKSASADVGKRLSLDKTPPEELEEAAQQILAKTPVKRGRKGKDEPLSIGRLSRERLLLTCSLCPADAPKFARWVRERHPASFSLDQVRAFRDALVNLVQDLEAEAAIP